MVAPKLSELDTLKVIYQQIVNGCSQSDKGFYVKHLCELEQIELTSKRGEFLSKYVTAGIPTEAERLERLREDEEWTTEQDNDILAYRQTISDNEKLLPTIILPQQPAIKKIIADNRASLIALLVEKRSKVGATADEFSERDMSNFLAYMTIFKDKACTQRLFESWEDFEVLDEAEMHVYLNAIDKAIDGINDINVRRIAAMPFFLNTFSYCKENLSTFLNKPLVMLTNYQLHLFSLGTRNLNVLTQAEGSPPEYFEGIKIDEIVQWYDAQYSVIMGKRRQAQSH